ncbi:MAG TPA: bifunctional methylenetetrahydrofolate dehydrogenase/methenyltetrahydrofolate cyclohydrolase, partial [Cyanobacteria bacterium UBA9579]|nr:bifunctional methylenetetrahydrofolate dehydrogenase/methenyltetrahydrofolate cyclohydrolase [Cyanobacteria bacterium UBA9579]
MATLINGKEVAQKIRQKIKAEVSDFEVKPSLVVIIVGNNPASKVYVGMKEKAAQEVGIDSTTIRLDESISQQELENKIEELNQDKSVNAILVQLPLPRHINTDAIIQKIDPQKDVDGFHPVNMGKLITGITPYAVPCTPAGVMKLLEEYNIDIESKNAVVVGRSNIVGKPISILLLDKNATVTICHSRTKNLKEVTAQADILIAAVGKPELIKGDFVKEGAVVIDVGVNRTAEGQLVG